MPDNPYEPVYAIVIIFVILLFSVTACVGLRVFRKTRFLEQQRQQQQEEGQPVNDIQLVRIAEAADDETIKTVTSKRGNISL
jgi:cytochrome c biogenesis protein ResB